MCEALITAALCTGFISITGVPTALHKEIQRIRHFTSSLLLTVENVSYDVGCDRHHCFFLDKNVFGHQERLRSFLGSNRRGFWASVNDFLVSGAYFMKASLFGC